jgi:hypothetical protein
MSENLGKANRIGRVLRTGRNVSMIPCRHVYGRTDPLRRDHRRLWFWRHYRGARPEGDRGFDPFAVKRPCDALGRLGTTGRRAPSGPACATPLGAAPRSSALRPWACARKTSRDASTKAGGPFPGRTLMLTSPPTMSERRRCCRCTGRQGETRPNRLGGSTHLPRCLTSPIEELSRRLHDQGRHPFQVPLAIDQE